MVVYTGDGLDFREILRSIAVWFDVVNGDGADQALRPDRGLVRPAEALSVHVSSNGSVVFNVFVRLVI